MSLNVIIVDPRPDPHAQLRDSVAGVVPGLSIREFDAPGPALAWCESRTADLLLVDCSTPGLDGLGFVRRLRSDQPNQVAPIILVSAPGGAPERQAALDAGAIDLLLKPLRTRELRARCRNLLQLRSQSESDRQQALSLEQGLLETMHELEEREHETLQRLARAIKYRDSGTCAYLERLARVVGLVAERMGVPEDEARAMELAAPLHDMGKIAIPDAILKKAGPLTEDEMAVMRRHPVIGHELLSGSDNRFIQIGAQLALRHHERFDGSGYPDGLAGEEIPLAARILAVADVFDALISRRPYKRGWDIDEALEYLCAESGRLFDPRCVDALLRSRPQLDELCSHYPEASAEPVA